MYAGLYSQEICLHRINVYCSQGDGKDRAESTEGVPFRWIIALKATVSAPRLFRISAMQKLFRRLELTSEDRQKRRNG